MFVFTASREEYLRWLMIKDPVLMWSHETAQLRRTQSLRRTSPEARLLRAMQQALRLHISSLSRHLEADRTLSWRNDQCGARPCMQSMRLMTAIWRG